MAQLRIASIVIAAALLGLYCKPAFAEQIRVSGLYFSVDEIVPIDNRNIQVSLFGKSQIIARDKLEDFLVEEFFSDVSKVASMSTLSLQNFIKEAGKDKLYYRAALAFRPLCSRASVDQQSWMELFDSIQSIAGISEVFKAVVSKGTSVACGAPINARILLMAGMGDGTWMRSSGVRFASQYQSAIRELTKERMHQAGLSRNFALNGLLLEFYSAAFGVDDPEYGELRRLHQKVVEAVDDIKAGDLDRIFGLVDLSKGDPWFNEVVSPLLVEAIHEQADKALGRGDANRAIDILAHIDLKRRTPTTHDIVKRSLGAIVPSQNSIVVDPYVGSWLRAVALADVSVKVAYLDCLDQLAQNYLRIGRLEDLRQQLAAIVFLRPDPEPANDQIRLGMIRLLLSRGSYYLAGQELADIQTGIPIADRIRFVFAGLYFDVRYLYTAFIAPLFAGLILVVIEVWRRYRAAALQRLNRLKEEHFHSLGDSVKEDTIRPQFVSSGLIRSMSPSMVEYRECLAIFGLSAEADLKTIKTAYRAAVKEAHPDHLGTEQDPKAAEKFIQLTKTYERLLELRAACQDNQK